MFFISANKKKNDIGKTNVVLFVTLD